VRILLKLRGFIYQCSGCTKPGASCTECVGASRGLSIPGTSL